MERVRLGNEFRGTLTLECSVLESRKKPEPLACSVNRGGQSINLEIARVVEHEKYEYANKAENVLAKQCTHAATSP